MTSQVDRGKLLDMERMLATAKKVRRERAIDFYKPYPKQAEFHKLGATKSERLLLAGNQLGKTLAGAAEAAFHLTGQYPDWWAGRRFDHPVRAIFGGETSLLVRDVMQNKLCGQPGMPSERGTGMIPKDCILDSTMGRGVSDAFDTIMVRHASGGVSTGLFKTYEQGREKWQADTIDFIWCDEEPPQDIYSEALARLTATAGMIYVTFTPMLGRSKVVTRFLDEPSSDRAATTMTIDDVTHISPAEREKILKRYLPHEREARLRGIPMLGSGAIFQTLESEVACEPFKIPNFWPMIWGIDFGIGHPFGAALLAWDRDADVIYVVFCFKFADKKASEHAVALRAYGTWVPVAWPQDGTQRERGSGEPVAALYKKLGCKMLSTHATFPDGSISTEAGIVEIDQREGTGRFKVFNTCTAYLDERRRYHRKDGQIVKEFDDILSAARIAVMAKRFARAGVYAAGKNSGPSMASGIDFDLFA